METNLLVRDYLDKQLAIKNYNQMLLDKKAIQSQLNLLYAQVEQYHNPAMFSEAEALELSNPLKEQIASLETQLAKDVSVNEFVELKRSKV